MNEEQNKDIFEDEFNSLPDGLREALASEETAQAIEEIGKKYTLHLDVMDNLFDEVGLVMLGITPPRDFVTSLQKRLGIPREQVNGIAREVNEKIFQPIRDSLKEVHGGEAGDLPTEILDEKVEPVIITPNPVLDRAREDLKELGIEHIGATVDLDSGSDVPENLPIDRADILAAIEDPLPQVTVPTPIKTAPQPVAPTITPERRSIPDVPLTVTAQAIKGEERLADDIFASKLTGTISIPDQKIDMSKGAVNTPAGASYKVDPYREPIS
jgi:hypothetical protein